VGHQVTITANYSDSESGVASCELYVEFQDAGAMTLNDGMASKAYAFTSGGVYTVFVHCVDAAGNANNGHNTAVVVTVSGNGGDSTPPNVGTISPTAAELDVPITLTTAYSDAREVTYCHLIVNEFDRGSMALSGSTASVTYTFSELGTASVYAQCADASGNQGSGQAQSVTISKSAPAPIVPPAITPGLVKLSCASGATVNDRCHSVYYRASDGSRHAFPNEKIYFTWYANFDSVKEISAQDMAALPLGHNVTYRPGIRMVKFTTDNKVFAVGRAGLLRWVSSEAIAKTLYGSDWNKKIDDLSDAFASDYAMGLEILNASEYSPATTSAQTTAIGTNF